LLEKLFIRDYNTTTRKVIPCTGITVETKLQIETIQSVVKNLSLSFNNRFYNFHFQTITLIN